MTREERIKELLEDSTEYCCYCYQEKRDKFQCCGEVHFVKFSDMYEEEQTDFIAHEEFDDEAN